MVQGFIQSYIMLLLSLLTDLIHQSVRRYIDVFSFPCVRPFDLSVFSQFLKLEFFFTYKEPFVVDVS